MSKYSLPGGFASGVMSTDGSDIIVLFRHDEAVGIPMREAVRFASDLLSAYLNNLEDARGLNQ